MRGVNKTITIGTLGADPEVKQFSNGGSITTTLLRYQSFVNAD